MRAPAGRWADLGAALANLAFAHHPVTQSLAAVPEHGGDPPTAGSPMSVLAAHRFTRELLKGTDARAPLQPIQSESLRAALGGGVCGVSWTHTLPAPETSPRTRMPRSPAKLQTLTQKPGDPGATGAAGVRTTLSREDLGCWDGCAVPAAICQLD